MHDTQSGRSCKAEITNRQVSHCRTHGQADLAMQDTRAGRPRNSYPAQALTRRQAGLTIQYTQASRSCNK
jgi:hypothetical protein